MRKLSPFLVMAAPVVALAACGWGGGGASGAGDEIESGDHGTTDARKDTTTTDTSMTDTAAKDTPPTDTYATDAAPKDTATTDGSTTDTAPKDTFTTDTSVKDTPATDTSIKDTAATDPGTVTGCSGSCDSTSDNPSCMADGASVCYCNPDTNAWESAQCSDDCAYYGGTGGKCVAVTGGVVCDCNLDCTDDTAVGTQCSDGVYTRCTCAAADPCSWVGDEYCDYQPCNEAFPDQSNLDDSATDCGQ